MSKNPETLTITECHQLLDTLLQVNKIGTNFNKAIRNHTMAMFMIEAGLRVGEVVQLRVPDLIYLDEPIAMLRVRAAITKRHTERFVPLSTRVQNAIAEMNKHIWQQPIATTLQYAFYLHHASYHLSVRQVERIISAAAQKAFGRKVNPHVLRHTFATKLMRQVNARVVQELLGHKNLTSTQIYTHPNHDDLKNAIESISD